MNRSELKNTHYIIWTGLLLLLAALTMLVISLLEIKSNEIMLATQTLGMEELWTYEGSLQWWQNTFTTITLPTTTVLTISGIALLILQILNHSQETPALTMLENQALSTTNNAIAEPTPLLQKIIIHKTSSDS